jgi:RNA polymerase sigma-70 factor (ECF subfamily)
MASRVAPVLERAPERFRSWVSELVHLHRARLARVVRREGVRADVLDCVQEAFLGFLQLPQARLLVDQPEDSARLLVILARNRRRRHDYVIPHLADDATVLGLESEALSADEIVSTAEQKAMALGCLVTLSQVQRGVVHLRLLDEVAGENVALQLGVTPGHVAVLLFRAKQQLRRCLEDAEAGPHQEAAA